MCIRDRIAFGLAWLCQVGGCMALLQQKNAVLYQLALIATMFCPLLAGRLVQKGFLRQPVGIGWKVQGDVYKRQESDRIWAKGYIVREACTTPSNWRCEETLDSFRCV